MFEAQDLLYIVIAFCVLWVTAFICWFVYHVTKAIRTISTLLSDVRYSMDRVEQALHGVRSKVEHGATHIQKMTGHIKKAAEGVKKETDKILAPAKKKRKIASKSKKKK